MRWFIQVPGLKRMIESSFTEISFQKFFAHESYEEIVAKQEELARQASMQTIVLIGEHADTITFGKRSNSDEILQELPGPWRQVQTERGGQATLHNQGQLVCYPILQLKFFGLTVRSYIEVLEESILQTLKYFNVEAFRQAQTPGVYTAQGKIAFIGVRIKNGVSLHGLSLNVCNDLGAFHSIRACGIEKGSFDKISNYHSNVRISDVEPVWQKCFNSALNMAISSQVITKVKI